MRIVLTDSNWIKNCKPMKCKQLIKVASNEAGTRVWRDYPCGQCMPCRITNRQAWTLRLLLEARLYEHKYFITLTYNNDHLPGNGTLVKKHLQDYIKRLRFSLTNKIRYYAVGEYGDKSNRPHYHMVVFSSDSIDLGTRLLKRGRAIFQESVFYKSWNDNGYVDVVPILGYTDQKRIIEYCLAYTVKKLTKIDDVKSRIGDVIPEFSLMSRRPGIGISDEALFPIVKMLSNRNVGTKYMDVELTNGIYMVRLNGKKWPLSRIVRQKIISKLGGENLSEYAKQILNDIKAREFFYMDDEIKDVDSESRRISDQKAKSSIRRSAMRRKL